MDLKPSLAIQGYAAVRPATAPRASAGGAAEAAGSFHAALRQNEATALAGMTGGADAQSLVQALAETQLAVEMATTVRDRVVEAYQEILRMPV